ncbi:MULTISPECIES: DUF5955 family protein [Streptomyces]|uniref:Uncharacterized protein n=1 Tax=Streptomyces rubrolavendulae TaxID=285473 RepID=A0A1D8FWG9_9ACTN|nr:MULTISPECIES: DUF5955 family protein [Streptomyces]AOT57526.1 hypothetical protein A4G23_00315 [Streptomyces rubrolavendulae]UQS29348.1 hypothetical protein J5J01_20625 [Streptomyces fradiae]
MSEENRHTPAAPSGGGNHGVQQYGGRSSVGNQAVGPGARAVAGDVTVHADGGAEERARVGELIRLVERLLEEHRAELPDQEAPRVELRRLREELDEGEPEPGVVRRALGRLARFAEPVAPVAAAVAELTRAVGGI